MALVRKICLTCGIQFASVDGRKKYCGKPCYPAANRIKEKMENKIMRQSLRKSKYGDKKSYKAPQDYGQWLDHSQ